MAAGEAQVPAGLDFSIGVRRFSDYVLLIAKKDPGQGIVWTAFALLIIGLAITFYLPRRRIWARLAPSASCGSSPDPIATSTWSASSGACSTSSSPGARRLRRGLSAGPRPVDGDRSRRSRAAVLPGARWLAAGPDVAPVDRREPRPGLGPPAAGRASRRSMRSSRATWRSCPRGGPGAIGAADADGAVSGLDPHMPRGRIGGIVLVGEAGLVRRRSAVGARIGGLVSAAARPACRSSTPGRPMRSRSNGARSGSSSTIEPSSSARRRCSRRGSSRSPSAAADRRAWRRRSRASSAARSRSRAGAGRRSPSTSRRTCPGPRRHHRLPPPPALGRNPDRPADPGRPGRSSGALALLGERPASELERVATARIAGPRRAGAGPRRGARAGRGDRPARAAAGRRAAMGGASSPARRRPAGGRRRADPVGRSGGSPGRDAAEPRTASARGGARRREAAPRDPAPRGRAPRGALARAGPPPLAPRRRPERRAPDRRRDRRSRRRRLGDRRPDRALLGRIVAVSRPFDSNVGRSAAEADARATLEAAEALTDPPTVARADRLPAYRLLGNLHNLPDGARQARALLASAPARPAGRPPRAAGHAPRGARPAGPGRGRRLASASTATRSPTASAGSRRRRAGGWPTPSCGFPSRSRSDLCKMTNNLERAATFTEADPRRILTMTPEARVVRVAQVKHDPNRSLAVADRREHRQEHP